MTLLVDQVLKPINFEAIPTELKNKKQWVGWKKGEPDEKGKVPKVPHDLSGKYPRSFKTRYSLDLVKKSYDFKKIDGIGFSLVGMKDLVCIDLDADSLDKIPQELKMLLSHSYAEISPSGNGYHIWFKGKWMGKVDTQGKENRYTHDGFKIEIFYSTGYVTFTGNRVNDLEVEDGQDLLQYLHDSTVGTGTEQKKSTGAGSDPSNTVEISDDTVLKQTFQKDKTAKLLFEIGDISKFDGDHSKADFALCKSFARITNDPEQIERLFKQSALFREPPIKHATYPARTIAKALLEVAVEKESYVHHTTGKNDSSSGQASQNESKDIKQEDRNDSDLGSDNTSIPHKEGEKPDWWRENQNGTRSLLHDVFATYVVQENQIVRYPDRHGDLYIYNPKEGIYEIDKTCRHLRSIIRGLDFLKNNQIREIAEFIIDMSPVITKESTEYLAVNNGLLHLVTMEFKEFTSDVFLTKKIPTNYNPKAFDEFVENTLKKVTDNHEPTIKNIHEMFGAVLYPTLLVPKMFYLHGKTAHNGKSTLLFMIQKAFNSGNNISAVSPQRLAENNFAGASIYGKMANIVDDQPDQTIVDSGQLKTIITGGYMEIEEKGKGSRAVQMNTVCITASNHYPNFKEYGSQINKRLYIIPFEHDFSKDEDTISEPESMKLLEKESAREYVLKLAVEAIKVMKQRSGDVLTYNEKVVEVSQEFAELNDPLTDFFDEYNKEYFEEEVGQRTYEEYLSWCDFQNNKHQLGLKRFKEAVMSKYNMTWGLKRIKVNGKSKPVKGFKSK